MSLGIDLDFGQTTFTYSEPSIVNCELRIANCSLTSLFWLFTVQFSKTFCAALVFERLNIIPQGLTRVKIKIYYFFLALIALQSTPPPVSRATELRPAMTGVASA